MPGEYHRPSIVGQNNPPSRIFGRNWTPEQLLALAVMDRKVQRHVQHMPARIALVARARLVDDGGLRSMVVNTMGGIDGTYYMVAALQLALLALTFPQLLTDAQYHLLVSPLEAAEQIVDDTRTADDDATETLVRAA
jgi:hypothetical protein